MDFFALLASAHPYLGQFDFDRYPPCFSRFEKDAAPFFDALDGSALAEAAEALAAEAAQRYEALPRRERKEALRKDASALGLFLSPAAARHSEKAGRFAALFRESWNSRFPRSRFQLGDYEKLMKGFDTDFFGITLRKTEKRG